MLVHNKVNTSTHVGNGYRSVEHFANSTSTSASITVPNGVIAGDLGVLYQAARSGSTPTDVTPSGWSHIGTTTYGGISRYSAKYRIFDGTEGGTSVTGMDGTAFDGKAMFVLRSPEGMIKSASFSSIIQTSSTTDPTQQTMTAGSGTAPVIGFTTFSSDGVVSPRTTSITPDIEINISLSVMFIQAYIQNQSPANYTWDMDDEGSLNVLWGFYCHNIE